MLRVGPGVVEGLRDARVGHDVKHEGEGLRRLENGLDRVEVGEGEGGVVGVAGKGGDDVVREIGHQGGVGDVFESGLGQIYVNKTIPA